MNTWTNTKSILRKEAPESQSTTGQDLPRLYLLAAAQLGRLGRYEEAECVLAGLDRYPEIQADLLDLRARMRAQQGRYREAEDCWQKALSLSPENQRFRKSFDALAKQRRFPVWLHLAKAAIAAAVIALVILLFWFLIERPQNARVQAQTADIEKRLRERIDFSEKQLTEQIGLVDKKVTSLDEAVRPKKSKR